MSEDMTPLGSLPDAHITVTAHTSGDLIRVHLKNPSTKLAFQIAAELKNDRGERLPRITWTDNYIELMPGEERELTASIPSDMIAGAGSKGVAEWKVKVEGWNTAALTVTPSPAQ
jgi:exo-1,4-beta-D-glucosaminidase